MKPYRQLAGQTLVYGLGTIIPRVFNFLLTPLYTYTLPESDFGIIAEMYSYVAFFMVILTFGMETTFFRFTSSSKKVSLVFNTAFSVLLSSSVVFILVVVFFSNDLANVLGYYGYSNFIVFLGLIIFFDVITAIPLANLRLNNRATFFAIIRSCNVLINLSLNVFFFVLCKDSSNPVLNALYNENIGVGYAFISNLAASFFTFVVLLPSIFKLKFNFSITLFKKMLKYAMPLVVVGFAGMINEVADKVFIKYLTPDSLNPLMQVGIYSANYKLAVLMTIFIQMFKYAAEPFFFSQYKQADAKETYSKVMTYFVIFCLIIFLLVTLYIDFFKVLIGKNYRGGLYIVPIVLLANMFLGIYYNLSVWYKLNNLTHFGAIISIIGVVITLSANFYFIPRIGYLGSAIATLACYFSMMVISYFMGKKFYSVNYQTKRIVGYTFAALFLFTVGKVVYFNNIIINLTISTLLMISFFAIVIKVESINFESLRKFILKSE